MAVMASLAMAPVAALYRDAGAIESGVQLRSSLEFQYKVARPVRGRRNLSTSRIQQEVRRNAASVVSRSMESVLFLCPFWSRN
jgi:hypothetical protein